MRVQVGGNTVTVQVSSSGIARATTLIADFAETLGGATATATAAAAASSASAVLAAADAAAADADRIAAQTASAIAVLSATTFDSVSSASGQTIGAAAKSLRTRFYAPSYATPSTLVGGAEYVRTSKAVIDAAAYPAVAYFRSVDRFMPDGTTDATNGGYWLNVSPILTLEMFGGVADGSPSAGTGTVNNTAMDAVLTILGVRGGTLQALNGCYRFTKDFDVPNTFPGGFTCPIQPDIQFFGVGHHVSGQGTPPTSGSIFMWTAGTGRPGRITTKGLGSFTTSGITYHSYEGTTAGAGRPFFFTTNTTINAYRNAFTTMKQGVQCDDDAFVLGGRTTVLGGADDAPFQGYSTIVSENFFNGIRRGALLQCYANANRFERNVFWTKCGSNLTVGQRAAFEVNGQAAAGGADYAATNVFAHNLVEISAGYDYAIRLSWATQTQCIANDCYDSSAQFVAQVRIESTCDTTYVHASIADGHPAVSDATSGATTVIISAESGTYSTFPSVKSGQAGYPNLFGATTFVGGDATTPTIKPATAVAAGVQMLGIVRSAAEGSGPSEVVWRLNYDGSAAIGGTNSPGAMNWENKTPSGAGWRLNGRTWGCQDAAGNRTSGAAMRQDSGSGGSYYDAYNFGFRFFDNALAYQCRIGAGLAGLKWGTSSTSDDLGISRNAAGVMEVNDGTAGTLRDIKVRQTVQSPAASVTPAVNGEMVVEATSNTTLTFKLKGSDGTVRSGTLTLAP